MRHELGLDPHSGLTVIFRSKRGDRVKSLVWDGTGLVLVYKRLDEGRFAWPAVQDGVMRLTRAQFEALFEGVRRIRKGASGAFSRRTLAARDASAGAVAGDGSISTKP